MNYLRQFQQEEMTADYYDRKIQEKEEELQRELERKQEYLKHIQEEQEELKTLRDTRKRIGQIIKEKGYDNEEFRDLYGFYSDYHKDVFGVRPHFATEDEFLIYFSIPDVR